MNNFYIGLITTVVIIVLLEAFRLLEKRLIGALTLVGIPFIYIGFSWNDTPSLIFSIAGVAVFVALSYLGSQIIKRPLLYACASEHSLKKISSKN
jgi:hypothetical protein